MSIEAMKQALEALKSIDEAMPFPVAKHAMIQLRQAIEQAEKQEPVAWMFEDDEDNGHKTFQQTPPSPEAVAYLAKWDRPAWVPLYTSPPPRQPWVGLTDEEIWKFWWSRPDVPDGEDDSMEAEFVAAVRRVLAAHGIKEQNT